MPHLCNCVCLYNYASAISCQSMSMHLALAGRESCYDTVKQVYVPDACSWRRLCTLVYYTSLAVFLYCIPCSKGLKSGTARSARQLRFKPAWIERLRKQKNGELLSSLTEYV